MGIRDDLNLYAYVYNDPLDRADPEGREGACVVANNCAGVKINLTETQSKVVLGVMVGAAAVVTGGLALGAEATAVAGAGEAAAAGTTTVAAGATETAGTVAATSEAGSAALDVAANAGQKAIAAGQVTSTSPAAAGLVTTEGGVFEGVSTGAGGTGTTNATVQSLVNSAENAPEFAGECAECMAVSNALNAGANVKNATMAVIRITTGKIMKACPACAHVAQKLQINLVTK